MRGWKRRINELVLLTKGRKVIWEVLCGVWERYNLFPPQRDLVFFLVYILLPYLTCFSQRIACIHLWNRTSVYCLPVVNKEQRLKRFSCPSAGAGYNIISQQTGWKLEGYSLPSGRKCMYLAKPFVEIQLCNVQCKAKKIYRNAIRGLNCSAEL